MARTTTGSILTRWTRNAVAFARRNWQLIGMLVVGVVAVVLGHIGMAGHFEMKGERSPIWIRAYLVLCLFFADSGNVYDPEPWQLVAARFLAPAVAAWALVIAIVALFSEQLQLLRLQLRAGHDVVCGLGRGGLQLVSDLRRRGRFVVAIEQAAMEDSIRVAREQGALVLVGDATEKTLLEKARVAQADRIVAICGDDGINVEIAVHAYQLARDWGARRRGPIQCLVQVVDLELCSLLRQHRIFYQPEDPFEVRIFNTFENAARLVLERHPLDRVPLAEADPRAIHLIVIGFGRMGQSLALQAARTAHFANGKKPRVTIIDPEVEARKQCFLGHYPHFPQVCDAEFLLSAADDSAVIDRICEIAADADALATIAVCLDGDSRCLGCALNLLSKLDKFQLPILVRMSDDAGLGVLLGKGGGSAGRRMKNVRPFGMTSLTASARALLYQDLDTLAQAIHQHYVDGQRKAGVPDSDPSLCPWQRLDRDLQDSNRQQADHIPVKLCAVGCDSSSSPQTGPVVTEFEPAEVELLATMEHTRWVAERSLAGWTPGAEKSLDRKTHPCLVPWAQLDESVQELDRKAVRNIPQLLAAIGRKVYRNQRRE